MHDLVTIKVGSKTVKISRIATGAEIRAAGGYGSEGTLYRVVPGKKTANEPIADDQRVECKNGDHFIVVIPAVGGNEEDLNGLPPSLREDMITLREIFGSVTIMTCPADVSNYDAFYLITIEAYPIPPGKGWNMSNAPVSFLVPRKYGSAHLNGFYIPEELTCNGQHGAYAGKVMLNGVPKIRYCWNPSPGTETTLAARSAVSFAEMIGQRFELGVGQ
ncbi:MAG: hypothetical protein ACOYU7_00245 [Bacillota bacterium]